MSDTPHAPSNEHDETRTLHAAPGEATAPELGGMPAEVDGYRLLGVQGFAFDGAVGHTGTLPLHGEPGSPPLAGADAGVAD